MTTENEELILSQKATANAGQVAFDEEFLSKKSVYLLKLLEKIVKKHPAKFFLQYHKKHIELLVLITLKVQKMQPFEDQIREMEKDLGKYKKGTADLINDVKEIPSNPTDIGDFIMLLVLVPMSKKNSKIARDINFYFDTYEETVQAAHESMSSCAEAGRKIEVETRKKVEELSMELKKIEVSHSMDQVLKETYLDRLKWLQLELMSRIEDTRGQAERYVEYLKSLVEKAKQVERIRI